MTPGWWPWRGRRRSLAAGMDPDPSIMKLRLFLHPPDAPSVLLEAELPDRPEKAAPARLRCFSPPPEAGGGDGTRTRAWVVDLDAERVAALVERAAAVRLVPVGAMGRGGDGGNVELHLSQGGAEARLTWWLAPPEGWSAADALVQELKETAGL